MKVGCRGAGVCDAAMEKSVSAVLHKHKAFRSVRTSQRHAYSRTKIYLMNHGGKRVGRIDGIALNAQQKIAGADAHTCRDTVARHAGDQHALGCR